MAASEGFEGWYRVEQPRLANLLALAAPDLETARDVTAEAFARVRAVGSGGADGTPRRVVASRWRSTSCAAPSVAGASRPVLSHARSWQGASRPAPRSTPLTRHCGRPAIAPGSPASGGRPPRGARPVAERGGPAAGHPSGNGLDHAGRRPRPLRRALPDHAPPSAARVQPEPVVDGIRGAEAMTELDDRSAACVTSLRGRRGARRSRSSMSVKSPVGETSTLPACRLAAGTRRSPPCARSPR